MELIIKLKRVYTISLLSFYEYTFYIVILINYFKIRFFYESFINLIEYWKDYIDCFFEINVLKNTIFSIALNRYYLQLFLLDNFQLEWNLYWLTQLKYSMREILLCFVFSNLIIVFISLFFAYKKDREISAF